MLAVVVVIYSVCKSEVTNYKCSTSPIINPNPKSGHKHMTVLKNTEHGNV